MMVKNFTNLFFSLLWTLPFIFFVSGYLTVRLILHKQIVEVPQLIGSTLPEAIKALSSQKLNARILDQKEDSDLPEGIVINQTPKHNVKLKIGQPVFLVTTRLPSKSKSPYLYNENFDVAKKKIYDLGLNPKFYFVPSKDQKNICIAQEIKPNNELCSKIVLAYFSSAQTAISIMPSFKGYFINEVKNFLKKNNISIEIQNQSKKTEKYSKNPKKIVIDQRPLPGSLIDLNKLSKIILTI